MKLWEWSFQFLTEFISFGLSVCVCACSKFTNYKHWCFIHFHLTHEIERKSMSMKRKTLLNDCVCVERNSMYDSFSIDCFGLRVSTQKINHQLISMCGNFFLLVCVFVCFEMIVLELIRKWFNEFFFMYFFFFYYFWRFNL